jgi:VCBS repeat protein
MRIKEKLRRTILAAAVAGVAVAGLPDTAVAAPQDPRASLDERGTGLAPTARGVGVASASGGGQGRDFSGDGLPDILAREKGTGTLKVYPHSGTYDGTNTYRTIASINEGWQNMRWIGAADITGDGFADVLAIDQSWRLVVAVHSGTFHYWDTLKPGLITLGYNWNVNDLVFVADYNADGRDDVLAKNAQTDDTVVYLNAGGPPGVVMLTAPILVATGGQEDVFQGLADVSQDGTPDLVFALRNGVLGMVDLRTGLATGLGTGWNTIDAIVLTSLDGDAGPDLLGRAAATGDLRGYAHDGYDPAHPYATYPTARLVGFNWQINDIIS